MISSPTPSSAQPVSGLPLALAYVLDAHNIGCLIRPFDETTTRRATFSTAIQEHGVVIRTRQIVVVTTDGGECVVRWRAGTVGVIDAMENGAITLDIGYRTVTIPERDERPDDERAPLVIGARVLLRGTPIEQAAIVDTFHDSELAHPQRLREHVLRAMGRHTGA